MLPVGLTTKRSRNKYARERDGELMVIHQCTVCEKVVINRIAADDSAALLFAIFESSYAMSAALQAELDNNGVSVLSADDRHLVWRRLFGKSPLDIEDIGAWPDDLRRNRMLAESANVNVEST